LDKNYLLAFKKNIINLKKILVITYYWPPSGGPGVQRVLKYCKYLPKYGWEPIILTVLDGDFPVLDESLGLEVENFKVFKTKSFSFHKLFNFLNKKKNTPTFQLSSSDKDSLFVRLSRWIRLNIIIPDGRIGWLPQAVKKGNRIISQHKIDAIFSSAPPYTTHLIAKSLSLSNKIPWVADFRDPWTDRFYNYENKRWWLAQKLDKYLEHSVIKNADKCITVSTTISRYYKKPFKVIHNGYDEDDFSNIVPYKNKNIVISYLGTMTKSQNPKRFFEVISKQNIDQIKYQIDLIGNIHPDIQDYIMTKGYDRFVILKPYVDHQEAIKKMVNSNFLLLVIPNTKKNKGIVTGKLFEYIRSMTKILMIGPQNCDAATIISDTNSGRCFDFEDRERIVKYLNSGPYTETKNYEKYSRDKLTFKLSELFEEVAQNNDT